MSSPATVDKASQPVTHTQEWLVGPKDTAFFTAVWEVAAPKRTIVFIHGYNEHVMRYDHYFRLLAPLADARIFAYDQRGFGQTAYGKPPPGTAGTRSKGGRTTPAQQRLDYEFWIRKEAERRGGPVWVYGHSMGGALALSVPTHARSDSSQKSPPLLSLVAGIISSSPLIHQTTPANKLLVSVATSLANLTSLVGNRMMPTPLDPNELTRNKVKAEENRNDPLCKENASISIVGGMLLGGQALLTDKAPEKWPHDLPLFIVHGEGDLVTCPKASRKFFDNLPNEMQRKYYHSVPDAYHEIVNEESPHPENLAEKVASFITEEDALHAEPARTVAVAAVVEEPVAQAETEGEVQAKL